jgi:hypothetical protein
MCFKLSKAAQSLQVNIKFDETKRETNAGEFFVRFKTTDSISALCHVLRVWCYCSACTDTNSYNLSNTYHIILFHYHVSAIYICMQVSAHYQQAHSAAEH